IAEPGAAALHALAAIARRPGRAVDRRAAVARALLVAIRRPFLGVAQHVVQAELVGGEFSHRRGIGIAVEAVERAPARRARDDLLAGLVEAIAVGADRRGIVAEAIARAGSGRGPGTRRIFPLRLARQAIVLAS